MPFHRVLIALDESPLAAHAVEVGLELARALRAEAALVYVVDPRLAYVPDGGITPADELAALAREGQAFLTNTVRRFGDPAPWEFLREGKPAEEILSTAHEWSADLIVIGTHGRGGISRVVMGSTADAVVRHAPCPVMIVRAPA